MSPPIWSYTLLYIFSIVTIPYLINLLEFYNVQADKVTFVTKT